MTRRLTAARLRERITCKERYLPYADGQQYYKELREIKQLKNLLNELKATQ